MENILSVVHTDDDEDDRKLFNEALQRIGKPVKLATFMDCKSMVEGLLENPEQLPDVIFLDINMPVKNGLACLKELRRDERFATIPIIMFTTSSSLTDIQQARKYGANLFLNKPSDFKELIALLTNLFSESGMRKINSVSGHI